MGRQPLAFRRLAPSGAVDRERTLDSPTEKLLLSVTAFADKLEREKARQRTHDAMLRKARAGHVTGGRVYGYDNEEVCAETLDAAGRRRRLYVRRVVNAGYKKIADTLNREGVIAPPPRGIGRRQAWAASTVREILHRPLYRGEVVWNQRRKRDGWDSRLRRP